MLDLEASPEHMTRSTTRHVEHMLLVAEPYFKSMETARRYHRLAVELGIPQVSIVANKVRDDETHVVAEFSEQHSMAILHTIPFDPAFAVAERLGVAPYDHAPHGPGVAAIRNLAEELHA
jgi:CO dehydrogenase maturation factor